MIEIHYTVGILQQRSTGATVSFVEPEPAKIETIEDISASGAKIESKKTSRMISEFESLSIGPESPSLPSYDDSVKIVQGLEQSYEEILESDDFEEQLEKELAELDSLGVSSVPFPEERSQLLLSAVQAISSVRRSVEIKA